MLLLLIGSARYKRVSLDRFRARRVWLFCSVLYWNASEHYVVVALVLHYGAIVGMHLNIRWCNCYIWWCNCCQISLYSVYRPPVSAIVALVVWVDTWPAKRAPVGAKKCNLLQTTRCRGIYLIYSIQYTQYKRCWRIHRTPHCDDPACRFGNLLSTEHNHIGRRVICFQLADPQKNYKILYKSL